MAKIKAVSGTMDCTIVVKMYLKVAALLTLSSLLPRYFKTHRLNVNIRWNHKFAVSLSEKNVKSDLVEIFSVKTVVTQGSCRTFPKAFMLLYTKSYHDYVNLIT
jgi:hypothetical protein